MNFVDLTELFSAMEVKVTLAPLRLDPLADLKLGNMSVDYNPRYGKTLVPFMDFSKGDRRWVDALIDELTTIADGFRDDKIIMLGYSSAKRGSGGKQTWQQYVDGLYADKVVQRKDYSEAQLKHLPKLIDELSKGKRLNGCSKLEFHNIASGKTL